MVKKILATIICMLFVLGFINVSFAKNTLSPNSAVENGKLKLGDVVEKVYKRIISFGIWSDWSVFINGSDPLPDPPFPPPPPPPPKQGGN